MVYDEIEEKKEGKIVFLNEAKGYGFIEIPGQETNVFFHARDMRRVPFEKIRLNDMVEVEGIKKTAKGYNAMNVYLVS